mmetsp:Transcript_18784/g.43492  ORF Transcript_18784/g.43492 Transcript_18784/m.43492 type:complete len:297 (-) Transcript_18784:54-944(-)
MPGNNRRIVLAWARVRCAVVRMNCVLSEDGKLPSSFIVRSGTASSKSEEPHRTASTSSIATISMFSSNSGLSSSFSSSSWHRRQSLSSTCSGVLKSTRSATAADGISFEATRACCAKSSEVGPITIATGLRDDDDDALSSSSSSLSRRRIGKRNDMVFPDPVCAMTNVSSPRTAAAMLSFCISFGSCMPNSSERAARRNPSSSSTRSNALSQPPLPPLVVARRSSSSSCTTAESLLESATTTSEAGKEIVRRRRVSRKLRTIVEFNNSNSKKTDARSGSSICFPLFFFSFLRKTHR